MPAPHPAPPAPAPAPVPQSPRGHRRAPTSRCGSLRRAGRASRPRRRARRQGRGPYSRGHGRRASRRSRRTRHARRTHRHEKRADSAATRPGCVAAKYNGHVRRLGVRHPHLPPRRRYPDPPSRRHGSADWRRRSRRSPRRARTRRATARSRAPTQPGLFCASQPNSASGSATSELLTAAMTATTAGAGERLDGQRVAHVVATAPPHAGAIT